MEELSNFDPQDRQAVFERVWKRVMAGREEVCPAPQEDAEPHGSLQSETQEVQETILAPAAEKPCSDFPAPCAFLGENCLDAAPLLQEMIRRALADQRMYQTLAKRVGGTPAKTLQALAAQEKGQAKRLAAAYFLISGVRYWPESSVQTPPISSYLGALRARFGAEQTSMAACLAAAESTADPLLKELFFDVAKEEWDHAGKIRGLVENV